MINMKDLSSNRIGGEFRKTEKFMSVINVEESILGMLKMSAQIQGVVGI